MSIASKLTALAFVSATTAAVAQNTQNNNMSTRVGPISNNATSSATGGNTSVTTNVINYPTLPQKVTQDVGSCNGPAFQAIFYKAAYGQTEVKRLELGPWHTGYQSRQIPDQNLIEVTPTSVTFEIRSGVNYGLQDRAYIANEIHGTPAPVAEVTPAPVETQPPRDITSTATGAKGDSTSQAVSYSSNASAPYTYRPVTHLTFTCTN